MLGGGEKLAAQLKSRGEGGGGENSGAEVKPEGGENNATDGEGAS